MVEFDSLKISSAIAKAGKTTDEFGERDAKKLTLRVLSFAKNYILTPFSRWKKYRILWRGYFTTHPIIRLPGLISCTENSTPR